MNLLRRNIIKLATLNTVNCYFRSSHRARPKNDLYDILGVSKDVDAKQIKKAYYKLAQEFHPDKNSSPEAKEKFTVINNAYQILSDSSKRQMYDQTGQTGEGNAAEYNNYHTDGQGGPTQEDIFSQFQGNQGGFEDILNDLFGGGGFNQRTRKSTNQYDNSPITMNIILTFEESVKGTTKIVQYERRCLCAACNGKKSKAGTEPEKCRACSGSGTQSFKQGMFIMKTPCEACGGEGTKIKHLCGACQGKGFERKKMRQEIEVPRGINDGMTVKMNNKGNFNGDLFLKMQVRKSPVFKRVGINALSEMKISVLDAILGAQKQVKTIEGQTKTVKIPKGIQSNQTINLKNEGFYMVNKQSKGDHLINITIEIPKQLSDQEKKLYQQIKTLNV